MYTYIYLYILLYGFYFVDDDDDLNHKLVNNDLSRDLKRMSLSVIIS